MLVWFYVDLAFEMWVSCVTELIVCVLLDFLLVDSPLSSCCFSFGCLSLFVGCLSLDVFLWFLWCLGSDFPVSLLFFDLFRFAVYVGLV
ncbi:hypothetical protein MtrunA17_Chr7g0238301 [Medicago truncatula]|uniref:Transmembrane protein n=1 Tax=Medicago truncatula TaxID=3880 RepID=A0A396H4L8_MEDTR|nr:hypothetical protein MtrunA17_Chr7g0238301 [Medicago truncatula]